MFHPSCKRGVRHGSGELVSNVLGASRDIG
jgi:hypothetical protein